MRKKLNQHLFVYLLVLSLVITLGMNVQPLNNDPQVHKDTASQKSEEQASTGIIVTTQVQEPVSSPAITATPSPIPTLAEAAATKVEQPSTILPESEVPLEEAPAIKEIPLNTYEVSAYYLNVRKAPSAKAAIIKVVKQGTRLEIASKTENGWLEVLGGGYVHGGYAKKVKNEVSVLSISDTSNRQPTIEINDRRADIAQQSEVIEEKIEEIIEEELSAPTSKVKSDSGLTEAHIAKIFEGTALSGHDLEQAILEIEQDYGINAYFTIAVMKLESGNGKSRLAKSKNNLFGLNAIDGDKYNKAFSFKTKGDSVRRFGQLLSKHYVGKGLTTIEKVARKYCPANSKWSSLVKSIMKSDYRKL